LGLCVNPANIDSIVDAFEQCIDMSQEEKNNFVENSDKLLKTTFNKDLIISRITRVLVG